MPTNIGNISFGGKNLSDEDAAAAVASFEDARRKEQEYQEKVPAIRERGEAALRRLLPIAQGNSGQCRHVAAFLLGLYNGNRFKFDLTDLRCVDRGIFDDCMAVLQMDQTAWKEVHTFFPKGGAQFEELADDWRIPDREKLRWLIRNAQYPGAGSEVKLLQAEQKKYLDMEKV
jgi:hypothetical protein